MSIESELMARAAAWRELPAVEDLDDAKIRTLTQREGADFATAVLYDRIARSPRHAPFIARGDDGLAAPRRPFAGPSPAVAILPGAFFEEFPDSGADGRSIIRQSLRLGLRTSVIPVKSVGLLQENARIVFDWLAACADPEVIVISMSKGGSDLKVAMTLPGAPRVFQKVVGWINICGTVSGTPVANTILDSWFKNLLNAAWFWWHGKDRQFVRDLRRGPGMALDPPLRLPAPMRVVHVAGFPLRGHPVIPLMRRLHRRYAPEGPNDGCIMLTDLLPLPGTIVPIWGADHYLRLPGRDLVQIAGSILAEMVQDLGGVRAAELTPELSESVHDQPIAR